MVGGASVHISKHSLLRLKITVGCRLCAYSSIRVWCVCNVYVYVYVCVLTWLCECDACCGVFVVLWCCVFCRWCVVWFGVVYGAAWLRKTCPCVDSKRLRVCVQDASVCTGKTPACVEHAGV